MIIQVDFANPEYMSQGIQRDKLKLTILKQKYFFSEETF